MKTKSSTTHNGRIGCFFRLNGALDHLWDGMALDWRIAKVMVTSTKGGQDGSSQIAPSYGEYG